MITPVVPIAAYSGAAQISEYRDRSTAAVRTLLPTSVTAAPQTPKAGDKDSLAGQSRPQQQPETVEPSKDTSSMFAAAVISGALSPTPQTMEELIMRIGSSTIPEESQARLKDLLA
ncbi:MAG: hypothetical protein KKF33_02465 [Alphaproteobacteria bacterium]|nr:hypothetical protein [Alphaproteobacteria bacterium]